MKTDVQFDSFQINIIFIRHIMYSNADFTVMRLSREREFYFTSNTAMHEGLITDNNA